MTVGVQAFRGARLQEARLSRGLFKNALADMVGLSGTAITRYEDGQDKPQLEKLEAIASSLKFSVEFFLKPEWPERPDVIFWRSRVAETKCAREMTEQRMIWLCELFDFLEHDMEFPHFELPDLDVPADFRLITPEIIENAAEEIRRVWRLREGPILDVILALENAGIPVVTLDIPSDKQDGFCFYSSKLNRTFVGINKYNASSARTRYDAAHELGHAILHKNVTYQQSREPSAHKLLEQQAFRFAGAFIFPRAAFINEVAAPTLDYFCSLKKRWGMSIAAMIYRAYDLKLIDEEDRSVLYRNMVRRRWRGVLREPYDNEIAIERPRMLRRGIEATLEEGVFDWRSIIYALSLPEREVQQLLGVDLNYNGASNERCRRASSPEAIDMETGQVIEFPSKRR